MNAYTEVGLGYDLRELPTDAVKDAWLGGRKKDKLIDAPEPLSLDLSVWSSVYPYRFPLKLDEPMTENASVAEASAAGRHKVLGFTGSLERLTDALRHFPQLVDRCWAIAATIIDDDQALDTWKYLGDFEPIKIQSVDFLSIGHDVIDDEMRSFLIRWPGGSEIHKLLSNRFGDRLNDHHLFERPSDAIAFRNLCATLAQEKPYVASIYRISKKQLLLNESERSL